MGKSGQNGDVLVAVEDPAHVQQLVRTAGDIALLGAGRVRLVTVVAKPYDSPFGVFDDETIIRDFADESRELLQRAEAPEGVAVVRDLVVSRSVTKGILAAVDKTDPDALLVGWQPARRSDAILGTTVDALIERADCDLYVERIGAEANGVDSVLLPVAGGPHVRAAARAAKAIAARNDASVTVLSIAGSHGGDAAAAKFVDEGEHAVASVPGPAVPVATSVVEAESVSEAIVDEAVDHDVIVLGATRKGALRGRLVGSVPRRIVGRTENTVILARDGDVVGGLGRRLLSLLAP